MIVLIWKTRKAFGNWTLREIVPLSSVTLAMVAAKCAALDLTCEIQGV